MSDKSTLNVVIGYPAPGTIKRRTLVKIPAGHNGPKMPPEDEYYEYFPKEGATYRVRVEKVEE